jgi:hypothetical protein
MNKKIGSSVEIDGQIVQHSHLLFDGKRSQSVDSELIGTNQQSFWFVQSFFFFSSSYFLFAAVVRRELANCLVAICKYAPVNPFEYVFLFLEKPLQVENYFFFFFFFLFLPHQRIIQKKGKNSRS